jgi:hypothetical protein
VQTAEAAVEAGHFGRVRRRVVRLAAVLLFLRAPCGHALLDGRQHDDEVQQARRGHEGQRDQNSPAVRGVKHAREPSGPAHEAAGPRVRHGHDDGQERLHAKVDGEQGRLGGRELRALEDLEHHGAVDEGVKKRRSQESAISARAAIMISRRARDEQWATSHDRVGERRAER